MQVISIYDPTEKDEKSRVRGIGRYLFTLKENFQNLSKDTNPQDIEVSQFSEKSKNPLDHFFFQFKANTHEIKKDHIFLNPFFNPIQKPIKIGRVSSKQIAVIHDLIPIKYPKMFPTGICGMFTKFANKLAIKNYDFIVTDSKVSKEDIIRLYKIPDQKIHVIYPTTSGIFLPHLDTEAESTIHHHPFHTESNHSVAEFTQISIESFSKNPSLKNLKDFTIYVGDGTWNKNLPAIAAAIKMADIPCVFVGKVFGQNPAIKTSAKPHPWERSLYQFFKLAANDDRFIFPGFISDIELAYLYKKAKVNILVSHDEGFGLSYIEAGMQGTPSVLSDTPIFHEIAGNAADFAPPNDPKSIGQKISTLFYDRVYQEKMSIMAFDKAQEYSPNRFRNAWIELLKVI